MKKLKLLLCVLIVAVMACGIITYQDAKPIAEDLPYLDGIVVR